MIIKQYLNADLDIKNLEISDDELKRLLKARKITDAEKIHEFRDKVLSVAKPRFCGIKLEIMKLDNGIVNLGFGEFYSMDLYKNLKGCKEAYVFCVTIGSEIDRLLSALSLVSVAEHFICDAIASALVESLCCFVHKNFCKDATRSRFSVGYGDLSLSLQPTVLEAINATKLINVSINENLLMLPTKTITAILGV